jgi:ABC-type ATPase involved in cell division
VSASALRFTDAVAGADWGRPLSFDVAEGAFVAIAASAGRSAPFFRLALGLLAPERGRVEALGVEPARLGRVALQRFRREVGSTLLPHGLVSTRSLRENVVASLVHSGVLDLHASMKRADDALEECGALAWGDLRPGDVPPDVRQRAAVARAIARRPRLLLLEDPVYAVPPEGARGLLAACRRAAGTVVAATHRRDDLVLEFSDVAARWDDHGFWTDDATHATLDDAGR